MEIERKRICAVHPRNNKEVNFMSDSNQKTKKEISVSMEMVRWWEKKRLIYNLIIIPMTILTLSLYWKDVGVSIGHKAIIIDALFMLAWCNVLYTSGWVGGVLRRYYLGSYPFSNFGRWLLFILGTIFSVLVLEVHFSILIYPLFVG